MAGLWSGHPRLSPRSKGVDARAKRGHDGRGETVEKRDLAATQSSGGAGPYFAFLIELTGGRLAPARA
jgi:hypothetical protein